MDIVYIPFLVDSLRSFLGSTLFGSADFRGFSVTLPHKETALLCCDEVRVASLPLYHARLSRYAQVDALAKSIGAVNTLVRRDGRLIGFNTDCNAAVKAIEAGLGFSLFGRTVVIVGAGGAGRAIAFGALSRGARVVIANRDLGRAQLLAADVGCDSVSLSELQSGRVSGDVLVNSTSLGMHPNVDATPVPAEVLHKFHLVFDAVYTPLETRLLREARQEGVRTVNGLEMFIGQAAEQFALFTGSATPVEAMRSTIVKAL